MKYENFKAGFVCIIGKPNVGKSTLMNRLVGSKLSIVSPKPQTTRMNIKGIFNDIDVQIIFLDTPGFLVPRYTLHEKMQGYIMSSIKNCDVVVFLTDITDFPSEYDKMVIENVEKSGKKAIFVFNKCDLISEETENLIFDAKNFISQHKISATKDKDFINLLNDIKSHLPISPPLYNQEDLSDMPVRFFAQEIIREKIFLIYGDEIPYSCTVVVEKWTEEVNRDVIQANIWIERDTQRSIIIGKGGVKIGEVRKKSEEDIMKLTGRRAVLNLWVKVKKDWRKKMGALHEFGYK